MTAPAVQAAGLSPVIRELPESSPSGHFGTLETDAIHVWWTHRSRIEDRVSELRSLLSEDEAAKAGRFHFERDRSQYIISRGVLRQLLASYLNDVPVRLRFEYSQKGKPEVAQKAGPRTLRFNVSHSGMATVFAFTWNRRVGVDVEFLKRDIETEDIARRFFSVSEQQALNSLPPEQRHRAFFSCWTRKEAYVKATGDGLSLPLDQFDVSLVPDEAARLLATRPDAEEAKRWQMWNLNLDRQYASAVVVEQWTNHRSPLSR